MTKFVSEQEVAEMATSLLDKIERQRERLNFTSRQIATMLNVTSQTVSNWNRRRFLPGEFRVIVNLQALYEILSKVNHTNAKKIAISDRLRREFVATHSAP